MRAGAVVAAALLLVAAQGLGEAPTPVELCPVASFEATLASLEPLLPGASASFGGVGNVSAYYASLHGGTACARVPSPQWRPSSAPLLINAGVGGTATTFVACVAKLLGLRVAHYVVSLFGCSAGPHSGQPLLDCTGQWDRARLHLASDTPVAHQLYELLRTHASNAVLITLRDPRQWLPARLKKHAAEGVLEWTVETPCASRRARALGDPTASLDVLVYQAWATCVAERQPWAAARPRGVARLNLFQQSPQDANEALRAFFATHLRALFAPSSLADGGTCADRALNDSAVFARLARTCLGFVKKGGWPRPRDAKCT